MSSPSEKSQNGDYQTTDGNSFISVIINANQLQFNDDFVKEGELGGKQVAMELIDAMAKIRKQHPVMPLVIRVFGNPEWLSDVYLEAGAIPIRANLGHFLRGFNSHDSLVEFVAEDIGMRIPAYRMRDATSLLEVNLLDEHCKRIIFGATIDHPTLNFLSTNHSATENQRLIILENARGGPNKLSTLPALTRLHLPGIFRCTELRTRILLEAQSIISRNAQGQRIDPPVMPKDSITAWFRAQNQRFCSSHFLRGDCSGPQCKARHDGRLDAQHIEGLRFLARTLPCRNSNRCRDPSCYAGHMCPSPTCKREICRFSDDLHIKDRTIVKEELVDHIHNGDRTTEARKKFDRQNWRNGSADKSI